MAYQPTIFLERHEFPETSGGWARGTSECPAAAKANPRTRWPSVTTARRRNWICFVCAAIVSYFR